MKKNKVKFGYISKRIVGGALSLTLLTTSLVGCSNSDDNIPKYEKNEQGVYELQNDLDYKRLGNCYFVVIDNPDYGIKEFYICDVVKSLGHSHKSFYTDLLTNETVLVINSLSSKTKSNRIVLEEIKLEDYVYANRGEKRSYSKEDIKEMLEELKTIYQTKNKELVKE